MNQLHLIQKETRSRQQNQYLHCVLPFKTNSLQITAIQLLVLVSFLLFSISCKKEEGVTKINPISFTKSQEAVLNSSNKFGFALFKKLSDPFPADSNIFISPLSISLALTMTYNGAANQTATDMQKTLCYEGQDKEVINQSCKELVSLITQADPKVAMEIANSIWYRNTFPVNQSFIDINSNYFNAEVRPADFSNPQIVADINNWVNTKTHEKINKVLDVVPSDAIMYLINAIYFKGTWKYQFDKKNTKEAPFYCANGNNVNVDFMVQKSKFRYYTDNTLSALEMPYGDGKFSMVVLVPNTNKTSKDILTNLTSDYWGTINNGMDSTDVQIYLPKFKFAYENQLKNVLSGMGMAIAFDSKRADFKNINADGGIYIGTVLHKSFVEVNEEGSEAAAVTIIGMFTSSIEPGPQDKTIFLRADRPFVFAIKENSMNSILFMGLIHKPVVQ